MSIWTYLKRLRFFAKNATEPISSKPSLSEEHPGYSLEQVNRPTFRSLSSPARSADTSIRSSNQRKFNPLTDTHSGIHDYE